jgi:hypothetical protein
MLTGVSEEYVASIFVVEEKSKQKNNLKQVTRTAGSLFFDPED